MMFDLSGLAVLAAFLLVARVSALNITAYSDSETKIVIEDNEQGVLSIVSIENGATKSLVTLGGNSSEIAEQVTQPEVNIKFQANTNLQVKVRKVNTPSEGIIISVAWTAANNARLADCVDLKPNNWYGGPQQKRQYWPIEKLTLPEYSYITKEADNCGIAEPYWLSSAGIFYFIDKTVPLFVDQNSAIKDTVCFIAEIKQPYSSKRTQNILKYTIGIFENARKAHEYAVDKILHKPNGYPDEKMITYPIWSTWARYKRDVNHDVVLNFADEINRYGFPNSQLEIDDLWEICYGSQTVDVARFPDMKNTTDTLKSKGFRVTIWTHPFMNKGCEPWYTDAVNKRYLVFNELDSEVTSWWNDNGTTAAYLDFTKSEVRTWYVDRLRLLQDLYGIDNFKFDGGETSWSPQIPVLQGDVHLQPEAITADYVRTVAQFGRLVEVRSGYGTQDLPIFVRMIDKDTYWSFENGLPTLITTMLQMNMNGYTLVLPDMIGGNGYNDTNPTSELFIRWLQANTFMPSLQFSYVPWDFDDETIEISKTFVDLHAQYSPEIIKACQRSVHEGAPVNPPIWWIDPTDNDALAIWDEYLLGENILVAPVVVEGARSRDIYLPSGTWLDKGNPDVVHVGPMWLRDYPAPLDTLPYFIQNSTVPNSAKVPIVSAILLAFGIFITIAKLI